MEITTAREYVMSRVLAFVADAADAPLDRVHEDTDIFSGLGIDSLGLVLILVNLKDTFGVPEPVSEAGWASLRTPDDIVFYAISRIDLAELDVPPPAG
ncbi:acyl carrier protein [Paraburkholderia caribensis]|nr:acyl carrier protein [Paraburkholderia caribensis]MCO4875573.1 acyl carrier protein [Paraburkholderia caribensis]